MKFFWDDKLKCYCATHNPTIRADKNGNVFGGGGSDISTPTPPPQPTVGESMADWVKHMPQVYDLQMEYAPQQAAQQVALAQEYAAPLGQAYLQAQREMYPEQYAMSDMLSQQAMEGMQGQVPDWQKAQYQSDLRANLGTNIGSPISADYMSRAGLQQQQDYQNQWRNVGLSLAGKQPTFQAQAPQTSDYMSGFTPGGVMGYRAQTYSPYASAYSSMYGANAQVAASENAMMGDIIGGGLGMFGSILGAGMASSKRFKKDIKLWA